MSLTPEERGEILELLRAALPQSRKRGEEYRVKERARAKAYRQKRKIEVEAGRPDKETMIAQICDHLPGGEGFADYLRSGGLDPFLRRMYGYANDIEKEAFHRRCWGKAIELVHDARGKNGWRVLSPEEVHETRAYKGLRWAEEKILVDWILERQKAPPDLPSDTSDASDIYDFEKEE